MLVTPVILSSIMRSLGLSATKAGFLVTLEMLTLALSTLTLASFIGKVSKRKVFVGGLLLILSGQIFSAVTDVFIFIVLGRMMVGLGGGFVVTVANATISSSSDPERLFSIAYVTSALLTAVVLAILANVSNQFAHTGVFIFLAVLAVICAPFCRPLFQCGSSDSEQPVLPATHPPLAYLTLLAIFIYYCVVGSAWAFAEQIAIQATVGSGIIGWIFSTVTLAGLAGGLLAAWLSTRIGRIKPIVACGIVQILAVFVLSTSTTTFEYSASLMVSTISLYFIMPYLLGAAAMFGENGRWGAAGGGASLLGLALSSAVGGMLVDWGGYKMIGIAFGISGTLSILILMFVITQRGKANDSAYVTAY